MGLLVGICTIGCVLFVTYTWSEGPTIHCDSVDMVITYVSWHKRCSCFFHSRVHTEQESRAPGNTYTSKWWLTLGEEGVRKGSGILYWQTMMDSLANRLPTAPSALLASLLRENVPSSYTDKTWYTTFIHLHHPLNTYIDSIWKLRKEKLFSLFLVDTDFLSYCMYVQVVQTQHSLYIRWRRETFMSNNRINLIKRCALQAKLFVLLSNSCTSVYSILVLNVPLYISANHKTQPKSVLTLQPR